MPDKNPADASSNSPASAPQLPSLLGQILLGQLRHVLTGLAASAITVGWLTSNQSETLISAAIILATLAWSALSKWSVFSKIQAAIFARLSLILLGFMLLGGLMGCAGGHYAGPSIGISGGYNGITIGVTLFGQNPVTAAQATPTPTPAEGK